MVEVGIGIEILDGIRQVSERVDLTTLQAENLMREIMSGKVTNSQLGAFLVALRMKGETIEEIIGFAKTMRNLAHSIKPEVKGKLLDTCGTGGDKIKTFNVSTLSALVVAGAGISVAKHGNRAVTSTCGSADLLEGLGVNINISPEKVKECIEKVGIGFMFAPIFHPAMKHAITTRRELKIRTVFNILGPLTNPAGAKYHVLGVFDKYLGPVMARVLGEGLGAEHVFSVHNSCGIDEMAPVGINYIHEYHEGKLESYALTNEDVGIPDCSIQDILSGDFGMNLKIALRILNNQKDGAKRDIVLMNSALGLMSVDAVGDIQEGMEIAKNSIESGSALAKLKELIEVSGGNLDQLEHIL